MNITENLLYRDTINFLKTKWLIVCIIVLFTSSITIVLENILLLNSNVLTLLHKSKIHQYSSLLEFVNTLNFDQQKRLLFFSLKKLFSSLVGSTFLIGILTIFIQSISSKKEKFFLKLRKINLFLYMNLFLLIFIITVIVQIGLLFLIVPGIVFFSFLSLSPIILIIKKTNVIQSISSSIQISLNNFKVIFPAVMLWFLTKLLILILISNFRIIPELVLSFFLNIVLNLISSMLIIYLFRLYMLLSFP
ncbi:MAG: YciC family protein [Buchnera aphidicola (Nurudea shiraii)]